jgi:hypothetical protein
MPRATRRGNASSRGSPAGDRCRHGGRLARRGRSRHTSTSRPRGSARGRGCTPPRTCPRRPGSGSRGSSCRRGRLPGTRCCIEARRHRPAGRGTRGGRQGSRRGWTSGVRGLLPGGRPAGAIYHPFPCRCSERRNRVDSPLGRSYSRRQRRRPERCWTPRFLTPRDRERAGHPGPRVDPRRRQRGGPRRDPWEPPRPT